MLATLEVTKHSCLGLYSLLEDLTIVFCPPFISFNANSD